MSMDLDLLPLDHGDVSLQVIAVWRSFAEDNYETLCALKARNVPLGFRSLCGRLPSKETGFGPTTEDPYGDPVKMVQMKQLKKLKLPGPAGAFVAASRDDQWCALWWH